MYRAYGAYDTKAASEAVSLRCTDVSRTIQSMKEESDINTIVKRFGITGQLPTGVRVPTFGDFTGVDDYRSAIDAMRLANDSFMKMPAEVRNRFQNDPQLFVEFCSDERNVDEMRKLGLAVPAGNAGSVASGDASGS